MTTSYDIFSMPYASYDNLAKRYGRRNDAMVSHQSRASDRIFANSFGTISDDISNGLERHLLADSFLSGVMKSSNSSIATGRVQD